MSTDDESGRTARGDGWQATRKRVLARDDHECRFCGISNDAHREEHGRGLSAHHIIPEDDGGRDHLENLLTVCQSCHRTLEDTHAKAVAERHRAENYAEELEAITDVWREFHEKHPVFSSHVAAYDDGSDTFGPHARFSDLQPALEAFAYGGPENIDSELRAAAAYGYKEGIAEVVGELEGWSSVPFDDVGDGAGGEV